MAISIPPSRNWHGSDGYWSTISVQLSDPAQEVELLPSTSGKAIWTVLGTYQEYSANTIWGCLDQPLSGNDCIYKRGQVFDIVEGPSSYTLKGQYDVPFWPENDLWGNYTLWNKTQAYTGLDRAQLGYNGPVLDPQLIYAYPAKTPYIGVLGMSPRPTNFSDPSWTAEIPSPLGYLVEQGIVPSSYWGYTAGAHYKTPDSFASLTFGGYAKHRGNGDDKLTVPLSEENNKDLLVEITGISIDTTSRANVEALSAPIPAFIDSVVPELWLPEATCKQFESALGLIWSPEYYTYIVSEQQHYHLESLNAEFIFTLGVPSGETGSGTTQIKLPYAAFDQIACYPLAGIQDESCVRYFPLKQAANESQIYLGRTFLQEAYVAADYDRNEFYVSQVTFTDDETLETVHPPGSSPGLSKGAIAGIAVVAGLLALLILAAIIFFVRRKRKSRPKSAQTWRTSESGLTDLTEYYGAKEKQDIEEREKRGQELDASTAGRGSVTSDRHEMESPPLGRIGSYEFPAQAPMSPREMESPPLGTPSYSPPAPASPRSHRSAHSSEVPTELAGVRYVTRSRQELAGSGENVREGGGYFGSL